MPDQRDPGELADQREREADQMEKKTDQLEGKTDDVRQDWERKRRDEGVPGAPAPEDPEADDSEPAGSDEDEE